MMLVEPDIPPDVLTSITVPSLVCAGSNDMVKPKETKAITEHLGNARLHIFEGETHGSYIEHTDKLAPVLHKFLNEIGLS